MLVRGFKSKCENLSLQVRRELGLLKTDALPAEALAEHLGVLLLTPTGIPELSANASITLLGKERDSWSAVTVSYAGVDVIIYNPTHSKARQVSDIMHEISHILLGHEPTPFILISQSDQVVLRSYNKSQEEEAGWLAACLLLPREALLLIRRSGISDREAYQAYSVSRDMLTFRMNKSGVNLQIEAEGP